jgi:hypothetical protein
MKVPGRHAGKIVIVFTILCLLLWGILAFIPLIALRSGYFTLRTEDEFERFPKILQQLGTFGDMYGMLNCFFSGAAFIGVVYAIILQRRQMHNQEQESLKSERATALQNRLTVYQNLNDHHRYERDHAGADTLLEARSKGRVRAFAELMANLLRESEAYIRGEDPLSPQPQDYHDHPARITHLAYLYQQERDSARDPAEPFGPVQTLLLELVAEIAALTELVKANPDVQALLLETGHAVNAAVQPGDLLAPESTPECVRLYQIEKSDLAFRTAIEAAASLFPPIDVTLTPPVEPAPPA